MEGLQTRFVIGMDFLSQVNLVFDFHNFALTCTFCCSLEQVSLFLVDAARLSLASLMLRTRDLGVLSPLLSLHAGSSRRMCSPRVARPNWLAQQEQDRLRWSRLLFSPLFPSFSWGVLVCLLNLLSVLLECPVHVVQIGLMMKSCR